jgi:hypothetical protein
MQNASKKLHKKSENMVYGLDFITAKLVQEGVLVY